jgi:Ca2+-binding EF-hand superfamily protein
MQETYEESPLASAFTGYDEDDDGVISDQEAQAYPTLAENFNAVDTNRSDGIDSNEYEAAAAYIAGLDFSEIDVNKDGVISDREAAAMPMSLNESFSTVDADADGNVSVVEYNAARVNLLTGVKFSSIDTDGDGVIDPQEAEEMPPLSEAFERVDSDADGLVSEEEFVAAQQT